MRGQLILLNRRKLPYLAQNDTVKLISCGKEIVASRLGSSLFGSRNLLVAPIYRKSDLLNKAWRSR